MKLFRDPRHLAFHQANGGGSVYNTTIIQGHSGGSRTGGSGGSGGSPVGSALSQASQGLELVQKIRALMIKQKRGTATDADNQEVAALKQMAKEDKTVRKIYRDAYNEIDPHGTVAARQKQITTSRSSVGRGGDGGRGGDVTGDNNTIRDINIGGGGTTPTPSDDPGPLPQEEFDPTDIPPLDDLPIDPTKPPGGGEDITSKMNPLKWVEGSLPGLNWLPMAMAPLSMLGAFGKDPVFNRHETSQFWRDDFKNEFKGISEDARTDPYEGKFFRNANRAALTSTNVMLANDAATTEKQRLAGGQLFAGGQQRALGQVAAGFYANQGNLLSEGYRIRDRAANMENDYVNHNTDKNQELFQFEVEQGTHSEYGRGMNLVNRVVSAGMAGAGMGLDMTGKLFDLTTKKAMAEQSLGHYEGGGGEVDIKSRGGDGAGGDPPWPGGPLPPYEPQTPPESLSDLVRQSAGLLHSNEEVANMKKYGVGLGPDLLKKKAWDKDKVPYPARRWT